MGRGLVLVGVRCSRLRFFCLVVAGVGGGVVVGVVAGGVVGLVVGDKGGRCGGCRAGCCGGCCGRFLCWVFCWVIWWALRGVLWGAWGLRRIPSDFYVRMSPRRNARYCLLFLKKKRFRAKRASTSNWRRRNGISGFPGRRIYAGNSGRNGPAS